MTRLRRNKAVHSTSVYYLNRVNPEKSETIDPRERRSGEGWGAREGEREMEG